jgi:hypothetical protein
MLCPLGLEDRSKRASSHGGQWSEEVSISTSMVNYTWIIKNKENKHHSCKFKGEMYIYFYTWIPRNMENHNHHIRCCGLDVKWCVYTCYNMEATRILVKFMGTTLQILEYQTHFEMSQLLQIKHILSKFSSFIPSINISSNVLEIPRSFCLS